MFIRIYFIRMEYIYLYISRIVFLYLIVINLCFHDIITRYNLRIIAILCYIYHTCLYFLKFRINNSFDQYPSFR